MFPIGSLNAEAVPQQTPDARRCWLIAGSNRCRTNPEDRRIQSPSISIYLSV
jgi:hypothetical protein